MMKTRLIVLFGIAAFVSGFFLSCEMSLGTRIDMDGPVVQFTAPEPRKAVPAVFTLEGTASDYSGVDKLVVEATLNNVKFPKQWRYNKGSWEVSENSGKTWKSLSGAQWNGSAKKGKWSIPINMNIDGRPLEDGEYMFSVQAWDTGTVTDDNSLATRVYIIDTNPPSVSVTTPSLYHPKSQSQDQEFIMYNGWADDEKVKDKDGDPTGQPIWQDPTMIGKFITQDFDIRWQIVDSFDIWSVALLFYDRNDPDAEIDENPATDLPTNYIYRYYENFGPPPATGHNAADNIKPNGMVSVPDLAGGKKTGATPDGGVWELENPISTKTTVKVIAVCYDAAGNANEERDLGAFIFWPAADYPWITYATGLKPYMEEYKPSGAPSGEGYANVEEVYMLYPGRDLKANAFHAMGVTHVTYEVYEWVLDSVDGETKGKGMLGSKMPYLGRGPTGDIIEIEDDIKYNTPRSSGGYSQNFPWEFIPPNSSGYYVVKAIAHSANKESVEYEALFRVQDISFPDFPVPPSPLASEPLFMHITDNKIIVEGIVSDATRIESLTMVWINPESKGYKTMSQLAYFRDANYEGWEEALKLATGVDTTVPGGLTGEESGLYDDTHKNRLWKLNLKDEGEDEETFRKLYSYSVTIDLTQQLNIAIGNQPLKSQMFLFRAENPSKKCTIITYAPQGDEIYPTIAIEKVEVENVAFMPGSFGQIPKDLNGKKITIFGNWTEDSAEYLDIGTYLLPNLKATMNTVDLLNANGTPKAGVVLRLNPSSGHGSTFTKGSFEIECTVGSGNTLTVESLRDALMATVFVEDIGGNPADAGASWLIESDELRFLRISSDDDDKTYKVGESIVLFLEFNKPVQLKNGGNPELQLNSAGSGTAVARYTGEVMENTRQYFTYTVGANNTTQGTETAFPLQRLNVTGLVGVNAGDISWQNDEYPFTFRHTRSDGTTEELRIVISNRGGTPPANPNTIAVLPTTTNTGDSAYIQTLIGGKAITIDTTAPTLAAANPVTATPIGRHNTGDIYINVKFSEPVLIDTDNLPYLTFASNATGGTTAANQRALAERVSGDTVTFKYTIKPNDTTGANELQVSGWGPAGSITDLPGTPFTGAIAGRSLAGVYLDTVAPPNPPTVGLYTVNTGGTAETPTTMMYNDYLELRFVAQGTSLVDRSRLEYTINYNSTTPEASTWNTLNVEGTNQNQKLVLSSNGTYTVAVRQYDAAGNVSTIRTLTPAFTWDRGAIVTRINSTSPNGTYTYNPAVGGRKDTIPITVYFRKPITITGTPSIELNVTGGPAGSNVVNTLDTTIHPNLNDPVPSLTFNYAVENGQNVTKLDVTGLNITATDGAGGPAIPTNMMGLPPTTSRLAAYKDITIQTGALTVTANPAFGSVAGGVTQGMQDDGSYRTNLTVTFSRAIQKGAGTVTVIQIPGTYSATNTDNTMYRLPAVLTEAQYNRFRTVPNFSDYYTKGTNGYINGTGPDTSAKYVLNYQYDTAASTSAPNADGTGIVKFADDFRLAEGVSIPVTSSQVRINGQQLIVELTGNNALQVPGATYLISYPAGFVQDSLGFGCPASSDLTVVQQQLSIGGVAKPFIRVRKPQETIGTATGADNQPAFIISNANGNRSSSDGTNSSTGILRTDARIDCRTPNATIRYNANATVTAVNASNFDDDGNGTGGDGSGAIGAQVTNPMYNLAGNDPARPAVPASITANGTAYTNGALIDLGSTVANPTAADYTFQGYQWRARAIAFVTTNASAESEEMAYRTVLTWRVGANIPAAGANDPGQNMSAGDQLWIRGGDAIGSSNVPGFPLTWEDDWTTLGTKRAGIRLLYNETAANTTGTTVNMNNTGAIWKWVTWEVNVIVYFDILLGRSPTTDTPAKLLQYGPFQSAPQRAGWTSYKERTILAPGKHRWLVTNEPNWTINNNWGYGTKGALSFSGTWAVRPPNP